MSVSVYWVFCNPFNACVCVCVCVCLETKHLIVPEWGSQGRVQGKLRQHHTYFQEELNHPAKPIQTAPFPYFS